MANTFTISSNTTSAGQATTAAATAVIVSGSMPSGNLYIEIAATDVNARYAPAVLAMNDGIAQQAISKVGAFGVSIPAGAFVRVRSTDFATFPGLQVDVL